LTRCASPGRPGAAPGLAEAWTAALRAACAGLLGDQLPDLVVTIDGQPEAILFPRRDQSGALDAAEVTADLGEVYQGCSQGNHRTRHEWIMG
jgi:hypothetical protein